MATFDQLVVRAQNMALSNDNNEAAEAVNDAYADLVIACQLSPTTDTGTLTSGKSDYTFSGDFTITDFGALQYLEYLALGSTQSYILEQTSMDEILALNATNPLGATRQYAFIGLDTIRVWPEPQTTGDSLTIYYAQAPVALQSGDVPPLVPSQWHSLIALGAATRLADAVGEDQSLSLSLEARYQAGVDRFEKWLTRRGGRGARRIQSGYIRSPRRPFHDNSTYYSAASR